MLLHNNISTHLTCTKTTNLPRNQAGMSGIRVKKENEKFTICAHVLHKTLNLVISFKRHMQGNYCFSHPTLLLSPSAATNIPVGLLLKCQGKVILIFINTKAVISAIKRYIVFVFFHSPHIIWRVTQDIQFSRHNLVWLTNIVE